VVAIDFSEDRVKVIALVGCREHILKSQEFIKATKDFKHFREMGSRRKKQYFKVFPRKFSKIMGLLEVAKTYSSTESLQEDLDKLAPLIVIVDDKLFPTIRHPRKVRESRVKEKHRRKLITLADNLANYFRILLKTNPEKYRKEREKLEKP